MKLLLGYDGSECSDIALEDLGRAGLPGSDSAAIVLSAAEVPPDAAEPAYAVAVGLEGWVPGDLERARAAARAEVERMEGCAKCAARRLREILPGWTVVHEALAESPAWAIVHTADRWRPDLIVLGAHGRSPVGRVLMGSVSQCVLHHAGCSVRIGRRSRRAGGEGLRIVLGVDGSAGASAAVRAVARRNWPAGTEVRVVVALDAAVARALPVAAMRHALVPAGPPEHDAEADGRGSVGHLVERLADELHDVGLTAVPAVCEGDPKRVLVEVAVRWEADCIFVGAKGMTPLNRFILGSVSSAVAARAPCSVEVVRV